MFCAALALEQMRMDLERQRLALESEKLRVERERQNLLASKAKPTVPAGVAPSTHASARVTPASDAVAASSSRPAATPTAAPSVHATSTATLLKRTAEEQKRLDDIAAERSKMQQQLKKAQEDRERAAKEAAAIATRTVAASARQSTEFKRSVAGQEADKAGKRTLDLCFVMDATGSMSPWIDAVSSKIVQVAEGVAASLSGKWKIRLGMVAYRDHCDDPIRIETCPFTDNPQEISRFTKGLQATGGGGDGPEDVMGGLATALCLDWQSFVRCIIWFGDNPCHGRKYHDISTDSHPDGDPHNITPGVRKIRRSL